MEDRIIFHIDVNNAFLSWTALLLLENGYKKDIRKVASVIGGDEKRRSGIVLAKSMPAKKRGIKTAETLYSARKKCPGLEIYPPDYRWYSEKSNEFHTYLEQYTPNIMRFSVDEAFLDFTGTKYIYHDYIKLAHHIKDEIKEKFGFTVNVGIANNMLCAKMASDFEKPDKVHTLFLDEVKEKMWPLPIEDLFMVGKSTSSKLRSLGINTIGDLAVKDIAFLTRYFKNQASSLKEAANGIDNTEVKYHKSKNESISTTETLSKDVDDIKKLEKVIFRQVGVVSRELRDRNKYCNVVGVIFKNNQFESYSKQMKLDGATDDTTTIYKVAIELLASGWREDPIRLIGVRLGDLCSERSRQISIFSSTEDVEKTKDSSFQKKIDDINRRFGNNSVVPASIVNNKGRKERLKQERK